MLSATVSKPPVDDGVRIKELASADDSVTLKETRSDLETVQVGVQNVKSESQSKEEVKATLQDTMKFSALAVSNLLPGDPFIPATDTSFELIESDLWLIQKDIPLMADEFAFDIVEMLDACEYDMNK